MNEKLKNVLLSLTTNAFDLTLVKEALKNLDCPLEKEIQNFVSRISRATTITEVFTAFFQLAPDECFAKGGAIDTVFKPLLLTYASSNQRPDDFYAVIYSASARFRNDKNWLPRVLNELSQQEIQSIFSNARELEIKQLFSYLKDFWDNEAAQTIFLSKLSKNTWIQFLNHLGWDYLSPLNLTALAKESIQLRHALASWLKIHLKQPTQEFLAFVEAQKLFAIPDVTNLLLRDTQELRNDFETAFVERENRDQENLHDFLMGSLLDNNASFQLNNLSTHDQLLAYGLLMLEIGRKKLLLEDIPLQNQAGSAAKVDVDNLEITKSTFFAKSPWLALMNQHMAFPTKLVPMLAANLTPLTQNEITEYLETAECLPESILTIEEWSRGNFKYSKNTLVSFSENTLQVLETALNIRQIKALTKVLSQTSRNDLSLELLENNLGDKGAKILAEALKKNAIRELALVMNNIGLEGARALAEALKISTNIKKLDLSNNSIGDEGAKVLANALRMNTSLTQLDIGDNNLGIEGAKVLGEALEINTSLIELTLSGNRIGLEGIKELSKGLKNNVGLNKFVFIGVNNEGAQILLDALEKNTCLIHLEIGSDIDSQIRVEIEKILCRNRAYFDSHNKITASLELVEKKLIGKKKLKEKDFAKQAAQAASDQVIIQNALNEALNEVQKLCRTMHYKYAHAEKLLHKTYYWIAATYQKYGDYSAFIALYFDYFVLHSDQQINFQFVSLLISLPDEIYFLAGLTLQDKQQLILALLTENHEACVDTLRMQALHGLKGGKEIPQGTLASVAGVGNRTIPGKIITFTELVALTEQQTMLETTKQTHTSLECQSDIPLNEIATDPSQILLEQIKSNVIEVAVYEQIIADPHQVILVKFENGVLNSKKFRCYAEEGRRISAKLKKLIAIDFYAVIEQDSICLFKELNKLSPSEVNFIIRDTQNVEIRKRLLIYLQNFSKDEEENAFLDILSATTWLEFLNTVTLEELSTLNLVEIAKESEGLPHALAIWIKPQLYLRSDIYFDFIKTQRLFTIPGFSDLIIYNADNDDSMLIQLLNYGKIMVCLIYIQQLSENFQLNNEYREKEKHINEFIINKKNLERNLLIKLIYQELAFPTSLISRLLKSKKLKQYISSLTCKYTYRKDQIIEYLEIAECLPEPTIESWIERYRKGEVTIIENGLSLRNLSKTEINVLARILKANTSLKTLNLSDNDPKLIATLVKGLQTNCRLTALDLGVVMNESVIAAAKIIQKNQSLKTLRLHVYHPSIEAMNTLAEAIKNNKTPITVELKVNNQWIFQINDLHEVEGSKNKAPRFEQWLKNLNRMELDDKFINSLKEHPSFKKLTGRLEKIKERDNCFGQDFEKNLAKYSIISYIESRILYIHSTAIAPEFKYFQVN